MGPDRGGRSAALFWRVQLFLNEKPEDVSTHKSFSVKMSPRMMTPDLFNETGLFSGSINTFLGSINMMAKLLMRPKL